MFENYFKNRKIIKSRKSFLKKIQKYETVQYTTAQSRYLSSSIFSGSLIDKIQVALQLNGLNRRKRVVSYIHEPPPQSWLTENFPCIFVFLTGGSHSVEDFWKKTTLKKPYWMDNFYATGLIYDEEFEREYTIKRISQYE